MHTHANEAAWVDECAHAIAEALEKILATSPTATARLFLSGGTTPADVYRNLASFQLDWSRVRVWLVDERVVAPEHAASNARLVRNTLLQDAAAAAVFTPLVLTNDTAAEAATRANALLATAPIVAEHTVMVFGMGDDGHTASLFPATPDLPRAIAADSAYAAVDATGAPVAGANTARVTLTPFSWRSVAARFLLIRGDKKHRVLADAIASNDAMRYPVLQLINAPHPVVIHYST
jgi:6-phosphogluconolactonase